MFALCLVQEETVKMGFCHKSVQAASLAVEEVVGVMELDEWQAETVSVETAILIVEMFVTFSLFGVYS